MLAFLARLCAILAGVLLTFITLLTCGNLIIRNTGGDAMAGAFELTAMASGAAIALFMPLCQLRNGNIIVDFFTAKVSDRVNALLDRLGALILASVFLFLAWRTTNGCINVYQANSETQIMGFPEWVVYAAMIPPFVLTAVIALKQAFLGFDSMTPPEQTA